MSCDRETVQDKALAVAHITLDSITFRQFPINNYAYTRSDLTEPRDSKERAGRAGALSHILPLVWLSDIRTDLQQDRLREYRAFGIGYGIANRRFELTTSYDALRSQDEGRNI
ncbi:unnamed protein product [Dibothriocephalus latus]|uniref:Uncharacterized protein n=1 Tax=Dibothriocephalus latus TaxID=60516 RepID=A0A3P7M212_DIBLA|nr:unnamed protein product [Dibothriocephalus latus]